MHISEADKELARIILKSVYTALTPEEEAQLAAFLSASEANRAKYKELTTTTDLQEKLIRYQQRDENKALHFQYIIEKIQAPGRVRRLYSARKWMGAAAVLLLLGGGVWLVQHRAEQQTVVTQHTTTAPAVVPDALPGKDGAVLTLADGSSIVLDSLGNGVVADEQGSKILLQNGQLAYNVTGSAAGDVHYNTLSTPRGRQFKVVLPDGTQVWLNSASSIRYPTLFANNERRVYVTGEAYFEVVSDKRHPFIVQAGHQTAVKVLGTEFNINSYEDEALATITLLHGAVLTGVTTDQPGCLFKKSVLLSPGKQAQIRSNPQTNVINIKTVKGDIDQVMAWHRGYFNFNDADLQQVMRQLARWYDLEVVYEQGVPNITFTGELSRTMKLSTVLRALEDAKVHFRIAAKKIIIQP